MNRIGRIAALLVSILVCFIPSSWALPPACQGVPPANNLTNTGCYYSGTVYFTGHGTQFLRTYSLYIPKGFSPSWTNIPLIVALHPTSAEGPDQTKGPTVGVFFEAPDNTGQCIV